MNRESRGVSPVIAVILMVSVTVVLSVAVGTFVFELGDSAGDSTSSSGVGVQIQKNEIGDTEVTLIDSGSAEKIKVKSESVSRELTVGETVVVPAGEDVDVIAVTGGEQTVATSWSAPSTAQGTIYVDDGGSDSTGDGSKGSPYATIRKGISEANAGQTVLVKAGVYSPDHVYINSSITVATTEGAEINGSTATTDCGSLSKTCAFDITGAAQPNISGFKISGYDYAIEASSTTRAWTIQNVEIYNVEKTLNAVGTSGDWSLLNFYGHDTVHDVVAATKSSGEWIIRNSTFKTGSSGLAVQKSTGNWTVLNSTFGDLSHGIYAKNQEGYWTANYNTFKSTIQYNGIRAGGSSKTGDGAYNYWKDGDEPVSGWDQDYTGPISYSPWCTTTDCSSTSG